MTSPTILQCDLFKVPLTVIPIDDWEKKKEILVTHIGQSGLERNGSCLTNFHNPSRTWPGWIDVIKDTLDSELSAYRKFYKPERLYMTEAWYQEYEKGDHHMVHNHGRSIVSSILYINFNPEVHKATEFVAPMQLPYSNFNVETSSIPNPREGVLYFWPGNLPHFIRANESDETRTILSMNFDIRR